MGITPYLVAQIAFFAAASSGLEYVSVVGSGIAPCTYKMGRFGRDKAAVRWLRVNNAYERGHRARERGRGAPFLAVRIHLSRSTGANCIGYFCGVDRVSMRSMRSVPGEWPRWLPLEGSAVDYLSAIGFSSVSVHLGAA